MSIASVRSYGIFGILSGLFYFMIEFTSALEQSLKIADHMKTSIFDITVSI